MLSPEKWYNIKRIKTEKSDDNSSGINRLGRNVGELKNNVG